MKTIARTRADVAIEAQNGQRSPISASKAFKLYDTYGLPRDFIEDVTRDAGIQVDWAGFDRAMEEQRTRAKASWKGVHKEVANPVYAKLAETFKTEPDFYFGTDDDAIAASKPSSRRTARSTKSRPATEAEIVLDRTSIYSESGGQVADTGGFYDNSESLEVAEVRGAYYPVRGLVAHRIVAKEDLHVGDRVATVADADAPRAQHAQPHGHAPDARRAAQHSRHAREAGRLARRARPPALRFFALRRRRSERTRRNRAAGERRDPAQSRNHAPTSRISTTRSPPARWPFSATNTRRPTSAS